MKSGRQYCQPTSNSNHSLGYHQHVFFKHIPTLKGSACAFTCSLPCATIFISIQTFSSQISPPELPRFDDPTESNLAHQTSPWHCQKTIAPHAGPRNCLTSGNQCQKCASPCLTGLAHCQRHVSRRISPVGSSLPNSHARCANSASTPPRPPLRLPQR